MATRGSRRSARGARSDSPESDRPRNLGVWPPDTSPITNTEPSRGPVRSRRGLLLRVNELSERQSFRRSPVGDESEANQVLPAIRGEGRRVLVCMGALESRVGLYPNLEELCFRFHARR